MGPFGLVLKIGQVFFNLLITLVSSFVHYICCFVGSTGKRPVQLANRVGCTSYLCLRCMVWYWRHDTQHNEITFSITTFSITTLSIKGLLDIQHNVTQYNSTLYNNTLLLCWILLCWVFILFIVMLNVFMPNVTFYLL